jgi:hypothetical protein
MMKYPALILIMLLVPFSINAQESQDISPLRVVILGDYQSCECTWSPASPSVTIIRNCVADFTSQQLSWTLPSLAVKPLKEGNVEGHRICILNTGQLDISLGVPPERVIENIENIRERLSTDTISLVVMAALDFPGESQFSQKLTGLNTMIKAYCESAGVDFIDPNKILSSDGILDQSNLKDGFLVNENACKKWNDFLNAYLKRYEIQK